MTMISLPEQVADCLLIRPTNNGDWLVLSGRDVLLLRAWSFLDCYSYSLFLCFQLNQKKMDSIANQLPQYIMRQDV